MTHLDPQPPPNPGRGDVWLDIFHGYFGWLSPELLVDFCDRRAQGIQRYGTPLQYDNGREPWVDAYQEYLDGIAYVHQARAPWYIRWGAIFFAALVRRHLPKESR